VQVTTYKIVTVKMDADGEGRAEDLKGAGSKAALKAAPLVPAAEDGDEKMEEGRASDSALASKGHVPGATPNLTPTSISAPRLEVRVHPRPPPPPVG
jgi:hypothetical protein